MNIVSFFSGAGGLDLGFIMAGHHIVWANDNDKFAVETYNRNIGRYENHNALLQNIVEYLDCDAQEIDARIPNCDLIIGGFPCQGFTIANLKRSMDDDRNFLYHQLLKAISVKQPDYFLLENVKGLENIDKGRVLPMILDDLQNCGTINSKFFPQNGNGYTVVYNIVNAINFGVPQNRERVIILGINNDIFEDSPMRAYILDRPVSKNKDRRKRLNIQPTYSVYSETVNPVLPRQIVDELYDDFINHRIVRPHNQEANPIYRATTLRDAIGDLPLEYSNDIPNHQGTKCKVKIKNVIGNRATDWDRKAPTIMGRGSGTGGPLIPPHPNQHRRLTVRETARIQTFPDNFIFCGSNSACYRQIGNAVPVLLAYNIGLLFPNEWL